MKGVDYGTPELIAERGGWSSSCIRNLIDLAHRLTKPRTLGDHRRGGILYDTMRLTTVALMELFGWMQLEFDEPAGGEGVQVAAIERTEFGDAMVNVLNKGYMDREWPTYVDEVPADPRRVAAVVSAVFPRIPAGDVAERTAIP